MRSILFCRIVFLISNKALTFVHHLNFFRCGFYHSVRDYKHSLTELISFQLTILKIFENRNEHIESTNTILKSRPLSTFQPSHIISCTKHGTPYLVLSFLLVIFIHYGVDLKYLWPTSSKNERKQNITPYKQYR